MLRFDIITKGCLIWLCLIAASLCGALCIPTCQAQETNGFSVMFRQAAFDFRSTAFTNRYQQAQKLIALMPRCPITYYTNVGSGRIISRDYSRPSFFLACENVTNLLGKPDVMEPERFLYIIDERDNNRTFFEIVFQSGKAVESTIVSLAK